MSADYRTEHYAGYSHLDRKPPYIYVTWRQGPSAGFHQAMASAWSPGSVPLGPFDREEIIELVELAEQAWPGIAEQALSAVWKANREGPLPGRFKVTRTVWVDARSPADAAHAGLWKMSAGEDQLPALTVVDMVTREVTVVDLNADET